MHEKQSQFMMFERDEATGLLPDIESEFNVESQNKERSVSSHYGSIGKVVIMGSIVLVGILLYTSNGAATTKMTSSTMLAEKSRQHSKLGLKKDSGTYQPTFEPTYEPSFEPSFEPSGEPSGEPSQFHFQPTSVPVLNPQPTLHPTEEPPPPDAPTPEPTTGSPSLEPTVQTRMPLMEAQPSPYPTTANPTAEPSEDVRPTDQPLLAFQPSPAPIEPSAEPTYEPTDTSHPTQVPWQVDQPTPHPQPTAFPSFEPTDEPTVTSHPTQMPHATDQPTTHMEPTPVPTHPTYAPTDEPTFEPTLEPTSEPTIGFPPDVTDVEDVDIVRIRTAVTPGTNVGRSSATTSQLRFARH